MKVNKKLSTHDSYKMIGGIPKVEIDARIESVCNYLGRLFGKCLKFLFVSIYQVCKINKLFLIASVTVLKNIFKYILKYILKETPYKKLKMSILSTFIILFFIGLNLNVQQSSGRNFQNEINYKKIEYVLTRDSLYNELYTYITPIVPNHQLDIYKIIDLCVEKQYNIGFLLTQAQLESHFGTRGEATKTNSMFNVIWCNFDDKNDSVEPYIDLMKRRYLSNGRSYKDLLNNFTDINGNRYAEAPDYEPKLKTIYNKINNKTKIIQLSKKLINLSIKHI